MIIYWSMYAIPAMAAMIEGIQRYRTVLHPILGYLVVLILLMASRQSGGDYYTYNLMYSIFSDASLSEWINRTEPIYGMFNWLSHQMGWGLLGVNTLCAIVFVYCLYQYALDEPKPVLLIAAAIPYLTIVAAIGYTRQGTAVALFMLGLTYLRRKQPIRYLVCLLIGTGFHSSVLVMAPLVYFGLSIRSLALRRLVGLGCLVIAVVMIYFVGQNRFQYYSSVYLEIDHYQSAGAFQRSLLNGMAGLVFLFYFKRWRQYFADAQIMMPLAMAGIASVPASLAYSTAVDRISLFLLPFQILVFSRFPVFQNSVVSRRIASLMVVAMYSLVLFVWLHMGQFSARLWLPYSSPLFGTFH